MAFNKNILFTIFYELEELRKKGLNNFWFKLLY